MPDAPPAPPTPPGRLGRQARLGGRRTPSRASWNCCCVDRLCCCSSTRFTVNNGSVIGSVTVSDSLSARRHTQRSFTCAPSSREGGSLTEAVTPARKVTHEVCLSH